MSSKVQKRKRGVNEKRFYKDKSRILLRYNSRQRTNYLFVIMDSGVNGSLNTSSLSDSRINVSEPLAPRTQPLKLRATSNSEPRTIASHEQ